jgi:hypothetical protein
MAEAEDSLSNEAALRTVIRDTIADICDKSNQTYGNICKLASRSADDKSKVVQRVFDIMTESETDISLQAALSQVDSSIDF